MKAKVGMIGLGIMGSAMAANLLQAGFEVIGYDHPGKDRGDQRQERDWSGLTSRGGPKGGHPHYLASQRRGPAQGRL